MSSNINRLVQPECGRPNPLVRAANVIAGKSGASTLPRNAPVVAPANKLDFAKEFASSNVAAAASGLLSRVATQREQQPQPSLPATFRRLTIGHPPIQQAGPIITAGDQLEEKYRKDTDVGRGDDLEFWQTLSQAYIGPSTISEERDKSEYFFDEREKDEYLFDERNPLKGQFEDPFSEGLKRLEQGDIPSAALLFEEAVQLKPDDALAWRYLGTTQAQNEKDKSAIRALNNCLKLDPRDQQARLAISVSLVNETRHTEACKHLLEWLMAHERYKSIRVSLQEFERLDESRHDYVRDKFVEAARMSPNNPDPDVQSSLGVLFNMRGEYDKAVDCFKAALSVQADDILLWNRLGATLANGGKSDEAVIAYRRALEIAPGFLRSRYNLAISLIHLSIYDEAARQLVQILNTQAAGMGSKSSRRIQMRTRSITSTSIWNTLRTVATLMNRPDLYPVVDGRDLDQCNELLLPANKGSTSHEDV